MKSRKEAHAILFMFDALAVLCLYWVIKDWVLINQAIDDAVDHIRIQSEGGIFLLGLFMPVIHILTVLPEKLRNKLQAPVCVIAAIGLISLSFTFSFLIEQRLDEAGYFYCYHQSERATVSEFSVYVKFEEQCVSL